jgi:hypothetical protein
MSLSFGNTFLERCLKGQVLAQEVDTFVEEWHATNNGTRSLSEALGFSDQEYWAWVKDPDVIFAIVDARRQQRPLQDVLESTIELRAAARASSRDDAEEVLTWLRDNFPHSGGASPRP